MNLPYSAEQIEEIKEDLYNKAKKLKTRELPEDLFSMFIDEKAVMEFEELCKSYEKKYPEEVSRGSKEVYIHDECGREYKQQNRTNKGKYRGIFSIYKDSGR